jgi:hypothetical protein
MRADQNMACDQQAYLRQVARRHADFVFFGAWIEQISAARQSCGHGRRELRQLMFVVLHKPLRVGFSRCKDYAFRHFRALT